MAIEIINFLYPKPSDPSELSDPSEMSEMSKPSDPSEMSEQSPPKKLPLTIRKKNEIHL